MSLYIVMDMYICLYVYIHTGTLTYIHRCFCKHTLRMCIVGVDVYVRGRMYFVYGLWVRKDIHLLLRLKLKSYILLPHFLEFAGGIHCANIFMFGFKGDMDLKVGKELSLKPCVVFSFV